MALSAVGLLSPGDMGHVVGRVILDHGMRVLTCLEGRSERTQGLAQKSGIEDVSTYDQLVREVDLIISILVPAEVGAAAAKVAHALKDSGGSIVYVDCNAIAPSTAQSLNKTITEAGSRFVDAGIIGPPPRREGSTRFYASGADAGEFKLLSDYGLDVRVVGEEIGAASGLKMTYAALTKGTAALSLELLVSAQRMGLYQALVGEFEMSQAGRYKSMKEGLPSVPSKARRWIGEMEEIAKTFAELGLTAKIYQGAADMYRFLGETPLADETAETFDKDRTLEQVIEILGDRLKESEGE